MTSDEALLLVGESIADAVADVLRSFGGGVERGPVALAPKGELALQGLPPIGVISSAVYVNGSTGGNVIVMGRRAARKVSLLAQGGNPDDAGEGPLSSVELEDIGAAAGRLIDTAATTTSALLEDALELAPATTRAYESTGEAMAGIDLAPRATSVTYTVAGETIRAVHLIPNALLIRLTHVFDDRAAARELERFVDTESSVSVPPESVREVTVSLRAELGRTRLPLIHASSLDSGAAVTLDRRVDDPVELFVNGRRFGKGELVATGGRWVVRITEITGIRDAARA